MRIDPKRATGQKNRHDRQAFILQGGQLGQCRAIVKFKYHIAHIAFEFGIGRFAKHINHQIGCAA